jgi:hypothetical protein
MATEDISRSAFDPRKRYAGVRMQQGRVLTDDDYNEGWTIQDEAERRLRLDVIGPAGSADGGFHIANPHVDAATGELDFDIEPGTFYLGGLQFEAPALERYSQQVDWLQQPASARQPATSERFDLVFLEGWQQPVVSVEDDERFEAALAGPDTSTALRTMRRVRIVPGVKDQDCGGAFQSLVSQWTSDHLGTVDASGERVVNAELQVTFDTTGSSTDLCSPGVAGGYLGAENQAIRVQLVDASHFTWGFDNASPLYRVTIGADNVTTTLLTEPKDQAHWPLADQIVEILPWSAVLPNGEKLAEIQGQLRRVSDSYDPDTHVMKVNSALPATFGKAWTTRADQGELKKSIYYFMRVWYRGDDLTSQPAIAFTPGTPVALGHTGLLVTFQGTDFVAGDHWIVAARPESPKRVVPWSLEVKRGPHGVRRFFAPLGVIHWLGPSGATGTVEDCRPLFNPLTRQTGCCTFTVGDGSTSHGHFTSIQKAIDSLPPQGGCVCVLPGVYHEDVLILGRQNVTLEGCGPRTRILGEPKSKRRGVIIIARSHDITVRSLAILNEERIDLLLLGNRAVQLYPLSGLEQFQGLPPLNGLAMALGLSVETELARIRLTDLTLRARDSSAVFGVGGHHIELSNSTIAASALSTELDFKNPAGRWPLVFLAADDLLIERNDIAATSSDRFIRTALGGIQIGGGSERVEIRRNRISGGNGSGITLGWIVFVPARIFEGKEDAVTAIGSWIDIAIGLTFVIDDNGCIQIVFDPPTPPGPDGGPLVPVSTGALSDLRIVDNEISNMGSSGIGVAWFFDLSKTRQLITTDRLTIEDNRIRQCLRLELPALTSSMRDFAAYAAIALADGELIVIRENVIESNGTRHVDPICGIFALHAAGLSVENNRILENAPRIATDVGPVPGLRGGIVCTHASAPLNLASATSVDLPPPGSGVPAARVHDNIVSVPEGRALLLVALGPVSVCRNQLTSQGIANVRLNAIDFAGPGAVAPAPDPLDRLGGAVVAVVDLGVSAEFGPQVASYQMLSHFGLSPSLSATRRAGARGNVLFTDNQVALALPGRRQDIVMSAALIVSFDDAGIEDNQFDCDLGADLLITDLLSFAFSTRVATNRLKEPLPRAALSAVVIGLIVGVSFNQSTHCLLAIGNPNLLQEVGNRALVQLTNPAACAQTGGLTSLLGKMFIGGQ